MFLTIAPGMCMLSGYITPHILKLHCVKVSGQSRAPPPSVCEGVRCYIGAGLDLL